MGKWFFSGIILWWPGFRKGFCGKTKVRDSRHYYYHYGINLFFYLIFGFFPPKLRVWSFGLSCPSPAFWAGMYSSYFLLDPAFQRLGIYSVMEHLPGLLHALISIISLEKQNHNFLVPFILHSSWTSFSLPEATLGSRTAQDCSNVWYFITHMLLHVGVAP